MRRWAAPAVLSAGLCPACDPLEPSPMVDDDDDPVVEERARQADLRAATHGVNSLDGTPGFVNIGNLFEFSPGWGLDMTDADAVRQHAVSSVHNVLAISFAVLGCEATLETDNDRTLSLAMQGCRLGLYELDADFDAVASVETQACDTGECPAAVLWDLDVGELKSGLIGFPKAGFLGPLDIRAPVSPDERMEWQTYPGFAIVTAIGLSFDTLSTASWRVREDDCIEYDMGARLSLEEREDELDELIGDLVVSARGIDRCPAKCATAGEVQISFGAGQLISWTHDTDDTITVTAPGGRQVEVTPPCAMQRTDAAG